MREWLKKLRKEKGLSQNAAAKKMGICQQYYSAIERGDRGTDMGFALIRSIGAAFDVSAEFIISMEEKRQGCRSYREGRNSNGLSRGLNN